MELLSCKAPQLEILKKFNCGVLVCTIYVMHSFITAFLTTIFKFGLVRNLEPSVTSFLFA